MLNSPNIWKEGYMQLPLLAFDWSANTATFVSTWSQLYVYPKDFLYKQNIDKSTFTFKDISQLYEWKNGSRLSQKKQVAFDAKIAARLDQINELKQHLDIDLFRHHFVSVSAIWKIFLLHIIAPNIYPIFDQHVFRSYSYLTSKAIREIPFSNSDKEAVYFQDYLIFFTEIVQNAQASRKTVDEALFSFGRFLKTNYGWAIHRTVIDEPKETDDFT